ncbi:hypothetical protein KKE34_01205 [Patescibacteria group bacterium]|nr:hypothetical protein [Patescibacteria group bacterium]MBU1885206.1 hypothetical protein [Patescibacteria group bacterium]
MKKRLTQLAISIGTLPLFVGTAFAQAGDSIGTDIKIDPAELEKGGFFTDLGALIQGALNFVMVIGALLVFLYLIMGGIEWITSGGDKTKTETARNKITAAVVGLIVLAASYAILLIILNFLGFSDLNDVFRIIGTGAPAGLTRK